MVGITQRMSPHSQGGMGKTALAIAYAWKHVREYPGGVFFVHSTGAPWLTKIAALADSLSIEHYTNEKESAVAVRDRLAQGKPTRVILDGADDRNDWDPVQWAAPEPCRCIVTTNRPALDGVEMYQIDGLSTDQGIQMLIEYRADAAEPQHLPNARKVVEVFAGFPMGLTIVGSYMQLNPNTDWQTWRYSN